MSYSLKCWKNRVTKNPRVVKAKNGRIMLLSKKKNACNKKSKFIKEQEAKGLLSNLKGIKVPILNDLPIIITLF